MSTAFVPGAMLNAELGKGTESSMSEASGSISPTGETASLDRHRAPWGACPVFAAHTDWGHFAQEEVVWAACWAVGTWAECSVLGSRHTGLSFLSRLCFWSLGRRGVHRVLSVLAPAFEGLPI